MFFRDLITLDDNQVGHFIVIGEIIGVYAFMMLISFIISFLTKNDK